ncbi:PA2169 family four-helix-bundle protein [Pokkaliibacter sp. CJK22405]|uniref:PA2169 family four-helix-bundle protein n=1 Tax=Pokkaliibacter sp. CJK22405 TaxID=3384615 RepID=UPI0039853C65
MLDKTISESDAKALASFLDICEDAKSFYLHAAEKTDDEALKRLFNDQAASRDAIIRDLRPEYEIRMKEPLETKTTMTHKLHEWYADMKVAVTREAKEDYVLVKELEEVEDKTLVELQETIHEVQSPELENRLNLQLTQMHKAHDRMMNMKDNMPKTH